MNVRHIGDDFTSLLYIAVTSSVFLYKLPIIEGGAWPLTRTSPHPHPSPSITVGHPSSLWRRGLVAHPPDPNPSPPPKTLIVSWEVCGWGMRTVWGGGVRDQAHPHSSHLSFKDSQLTVSVWGGGDGLEGWPTVRGGRVRVRGMRAGVGGRWYHALHGSGEVNLLHRLWGIQRVALSAVGECAEWN
jgi:hypothetical protein